MRVRGRPPLLAIVAVLAAPFLLLAALALAVAYAFENLPRITAAGLGLLLGAVIWARFGG